MSAGRAVDPEHLADVAGRALSALGDTSVTAPGDVEAQVHVGGYHHALTRFANSRIHQNVETETITVTLKVAIGQRVATASGARTDRDGLLDLARRAVDAAGVRPVDAGWPGVAGGDVVGVDDAVPGAVEWWDEAVAAASPAARAAAVATFLAEGAGGQDGAGYCDTLAAASAVATTAGRLVAGRWTRATVDGIFLSAPEGGHTPAGNGHVTSARLAEVTAGAGPAGAGAARRCAESRGARDVPTGEYPVVLLPECVADTLAFLADGFSAKAVQEGQSFAEPGAPLFDPALRLVDDVAQAGSVGLPFDSDGMPRRPVALMRDGRCDGLLHDRRTAARQRTGGEPAISTGHGHPSSDVWGPAPAALRLAPGPAGGAGGSDDGAGLVGGLERGLLVSCFNYCRVLDPKTMEVTGLTRNGTFWVEDGRIVRPVTNLRFTQSFVEALGPGRVEAVGGRARFADCEWGPGLVHTPALRLSAWRFTGGAAG